MKMLIKDTLREIKKSLGRFMSIFAIVAIGVAFFAGVKASAPVMKYSADRYYDETNLMDIRVLSSLGFNAADVEKIRQIKGIEGIFPTHTLDVLVKTGTIENVVKVMTLPSDRSMDNLDYMNQAVIVEGRLPEKINECVIETSRMANLGVDIGDTITLESGDDTDLAETLKTTDFVVVGKVKTSFFLSYQKGSSSIGDGSIATFIMIPELAFDMNIYTDLFLTIKGAKAENSYEDAYFELSDPIKEQLEALGKIQAPLRGKEVKDDAYHQYNDGLNSYYRNKSQAEIEVYNARAQLNSSYFDLIDGELKLNQSQLDFDQTMRENQSLIDEGWRQYNDGHSQYELELETFNSKKAEVMDQVKQLLDGIKTLEAKQIELNDQLKQIEEALASGMLPAQQVALLQGQRTELLAGIKTVNEQLETLNEQYLPIQGQLDEGQALLDGAKAQLETTEKTLKANEEALSQAQTTAKSEFASAKVVIDDGWKAYDSGLIELENSIKIMDEKFLDAREELEKAEEDILALEDGEWFVLDRESHYSYMDYGSAADRMAAIAKIFPLFFFLVAALICLTTMTRMVDEQRDTIGTLKALGYGKAMIAMKYLSYAFLSSIGGSILGVIIGFVIFPLVIYNAWNIMYELPAASLLFLPDLAFQAGAAAIAITMIATFMAVNKELVETPALLMRPKAPKNGKRIFLERIPLIWKHLSFSKKVTARNLFRYKKRFFMTVIGISGCTALLVAGFGIQDSIGDIVPKQFSEIQNYDMSIQYDDKLNVVEKEDVAKEIREIEEVSDLMEISQDNGTVTIKGKEQTVRILVPMDIDKFKEFTALRTRVGHTPVAILETGAVISEKMASDLGIKVGDTFKCMNSDDVTKEILVTGIVENYIEHYVYMSMDSYKATYGLTPKATNMIAKVDELDEKLENRLGTEINAIDNVASISFYRGVADQFNDMIKSLGIVVVVLIISAGLLAFVVLYNLTNVNISERVREIATIKVLGFYDNEVSTYVFRENLILSFIGSLCGLILGTGLHRLIMSLAELDSVMFGRSILLQSYVLSVAITMFFSWIVAKVMYYKLVKIPMVESLKSVE